MTRTRWVLGGLLVGALLLGLYLSRSDASARANERALQIEDGEYEPTPLEVPLTVDFAKAAAKRVKSDNYRKELAKIERELRALKALK